MTCLTGHICLVTVEYAGRARRCLGDTGRLLYREGAVVVVDTGYSG